MTQAQNRIEWIEVAKAAGAFGVRGCVRVIPISGGASLQSNITWSLKSREGSVRLLTPESVTPHGDFFLVRFQEIQNKEEADLCRGVLCVRRQDFPAIENDEHWAVDLIGFAVINAEGVKLGILSSFDNNGAQDILVVTGTHTYLIPMVKIYVLAIDEARRTIRVDWHEDWS